MVYPPGTGAPAAGERVASAATGHPHRFRARVTGIGRREKAA